MSEVWISGDTYAPSWAERRPWQLPYPRPRKRAYRLVNENHVLTIHDTREEMELWQQLLPGTQQSVLA